jgi:hypothetical protein
MSFPRLAALALALGSLAVVGCKQDLGERCEQGSDCASGFCAGSTASMMTMAMGRVCTGPPTATPVVDSGSQEDAAVDAADAGGDAADGAALETGFEVSAPDAHEAGASEGGTDGSGAETDHGAVDGATDLAQDGG